MSDATVAATTSTSSRDTAPSIRRSAAPDRRAKSIPAIARVTRGDGEAVALGVGLGAADGAAEGSGDGGRSARAGEDGAALRTPAGPHAARQSRGPGGERGVT